MARVRLQAVIADEAGNRVGGTGYEVRFYQAGTNTLAAVYSDGAAGPAIANPAFPNAGNQALLTSATLTTDVLLVVDSSTGFSPGQFITVDNGVTRVERCIQSINTGVQIQLTAAIGVAYGIGAQVNGRESLGYVAGYADNTTDIEMTVKTLSTGVESPRELFLIAPVSDLIKIGDVDLNGLANYTFTAIPQDGSKLILDVICRDNSATNGNDLLNLQLGTGGGAVDAAANYWYEQQVVRGVANVAPGEGLGQTVLQVGLCAGGGLADANFFATTDIEFLNYKETIGGYKTARSQSSAPTGALTTNVAFYDMAGYWKNAGGITSIKIVPSAGTAFANGSRARLYKQK